MNKFGFVAKRASAILLSALTVLSAAAFSACGENGTGGTIGGNNGGGNTHTCEFDKGVVEKEATCTQDGVKKVTCKTCGKSMRLTIEGGHQYGDWIVETGADCVHEGQKSQTCKVCNDKITQPIERTEHDFYPCVATDEQYHNKECKDCGEHQYGQHDMKDGRCSDCGYEDGDTCGLVFESFLEGYMLKGAGYDSALRNIKIPATYKGLPVIAINYNALDEFYLLESITIPAGVRFIYNIGELPNPFCSSNYLKEIIVNENNEHFSSENGILYNKDKTVIYRVAPLDFTTFTVPEGVTEIGNGAFYSCVYLESIKFTNNLTKIGEKAFKNCRNLSDVTIPQSVELIDSYAFDGCDSLKNVTFEHTRYDAEGFNQSAILGNLLASSSTAASYLTKKYVSFRFVKKEQDS